MAFRVGLNFPYPQYYDYIRQHGIEVEPFQLADRNNVEQNIAAMKDFDAIIAIGELFNNEVLDGIKDRVKIVVRHGIGYDRVDIDHAAKLGICCCNTPGAMSMSVAESALILILECCRKFYYFDRKLKEGKWTADPVTDHLDGKTVGFVGFGNIAQYLARYLQPFNCKLLAYDIHYNEDALEKYHVRKATLEEVARESDFVSIHTPHNAATDKMINAGFLSMMKPEAYLINTARGKIVNEKDLIEALKKHQIAGAGLDVFEEEPIAPDNELTKLDNVFLTPHIATRTYRGFQNGFDGVIQALREFMAGEVPKFCLNREYVKHCGTDGGKGV